MESSVSGGACARVGNSRLVWLTLSCALLYHAGPSYRHSSFVTTYAAPENHIRTLYDNLERLHPEVRQRALR